VSVPDKDIIALVFVFRWGELEERTRPRNFGAGLLRMTWLAFGTGAPETSVSSAGVNTKRESL
jgi:hypothetical protein